MKFAIPIAAFVFLIAPFITPLQAQDAKEVYFEKCALCHGQDGGGKTAMGRKQKVTDVREAVKRFTADQMVKIVTEGSGSMDGYGKELTRDQVKAVVEHYRMLAK